MGAGGPGGRDTGGIGIPGIGGKGAKGGRPVSRRKKKNQISDELAVIVGHTNPSRREDSLAASFQGIQVGASHGRPLGGA